MNINMVIFVMCPVMVPLSLPATERVESNGTLC